MSIPAVLSARPYWTVLCIGACSAAQLTAADGDWYRWRGPDQNGISPFKELAATFPAAGPRKVWQAQIGTGFSSIVVSDGRVYSLGNQGGKDTIHCLDANDGKTVWSHAYDAPVDPNLYEGGPNATPTIAGGQLFSLGRRGQAACLDKATGKVIWSKNLAQEVGAGVPDWGFSGSPLVDGDLVIYNVGAAGTAVERSTGKVVWRSGGGKAGYASPVAFSLNNQRGVALFTAKALTALDPATGRALWSFPWETSYDVNAADPLVLGDYFFISSGYNKGCALIRVQGNQPALVWQNRNLRTQFNPAVFLAGHLYGVDGNTNERAMLNCLDLRTGQVRWSQPGVGSGSVIAAGDKLIVLGDKGQLFVGPASPAGFRPTARAQILGGKTWTTPALSQGRLYARNAKGDLVCFDLAKAPAN